MTVSVLAISPGMYIDDVSGTSSSRPGDHTRTHARDGCVNYMHWLGHRSSGLGGAPLLALLTIESESLDAAYRSSAICSCCSEAPRRSSSSSSCCLMGPNRSSGSVVMLTDCPCAMVSLGDREDGV